MRRDEQLTARLITVILRNKYLTAKQIDAIVKASKPSLIRKVLGNKTVQTVVGVAAAVGAAVVASTYDVGLHPVETIALV